MLQVRDLIGFLIIFCFLLAFIFVWAFVSRRKRRAKALKKIELQKMAEGVDTKTPVVVTSQTHVVDGGYTVTQVPNVTGPYQGNVYTTPPYPVQTTGPQQPMPMPPMPMPMPMPGGAQQPYMAPYPPPAGVNPANMNPPSYDVAVSGPGAGHPNNAPYAKQAPYNPHYPGQ